MEIFHRAGNWLKELTLGPKGVWRRKGRKAHGRESLPGFRLFVFEKEHPDLVKRNPTTDTWQLLTELSSLGGLQIELAETSILFKPTGKQVDIYILPRLS